MEIKVFVRHSSGCPHSSDEYYKRCNCRKWLYCSDWKPDPRRSAKTRSWTRAVELARSLERDNSAIESVRVDAAVRDYLKDKLQQNVSDGYHSKLTSLLEGRLLSWCSEKKIGRVGQLDIQALKEFRATWNANSLTRSKWQERLRSFLLYCQRHRWINDNPAALLSRIKVDQIPTDYFTQDEMANILAAVDQYHGRGDAVDLWRRRTTAFIRVSSETGLRLSDVAMLRADRIIDGKILLYTQKTKVPVSLPLREDLLALLESLPLQHGQHYFWNGRKSVNTLRNNWWRTLSRVFAHAKLGKRAHPHMFRDTFAVNMLLGGVPLDQVSILLGHKSVKITEKSYAPWVKARQDQLEISVRKAWGASDASL